MVKQGYFPMQAHSTADWFAVYGAIANFLIIVNAVGFVVFLTNYFSPPPDRKNIFMSGIFFLIVAIGTYMISDQYLTGDMHGTAQLLAPRFKFLGAVGTFGFGAIGAGLLLQSMFTKSPERLPTEREIVMQVLAELTKEEDPQGAEDAKKNQTHKYQPRTFSRKNSSRKKE